MSNAFLERLPVEPPIREELRALGYREPAGLYGAIRANRPAFSTWLGESTLQVVERALRPMLKPENMSARREHRDRGMGLGAILDTPPPALREAPFDVAIRDALYQELQELERQPASPGNTRRITELTDRITRLIEGE